MHLLQHQAKRQSDQMVLSGQWRDALKRPAAVRISVEKGELAPLPDQVPDMITGDVSEIHGILFAIADMAWGMGWRPRGLMGHVAHTIEAYKLPPDVRR